MPATHPYLITLGTTPVPDDHWAILRGSRYRARHRRTRLRNDRNGTATQSTITPGTTAPGTTTPGMTTPGTTATGTRRGGAHRSPNRRPAGTATVLSRPAGHRRKSGPGRHRATRIDMPYARAARRTRRNWSWHGAPRPIARTVLPALLIVSICATFIGAWFTASGAAAFAGIIGR